ncbi:hypothetical protein CABS01_06786 [Colletotrichum abscissum]|uniref:uncharacterized protein n=1 Tax=Colletotrichum abscissum TaxID=1671311 RepID=UPI0027D66A90|nr:uncharacterized protein CABS01_06786 [Colletotrichum abscissum]KAK1514807.1 hypothetical protein CABS01_06786 [Colletotrichum abscissum]
MSKNSTTEKNINRWEAAFRRKGTSGRPEKQEAWIAEAESFIRRDTRHELGLLNSTTRSLIETEMKAPVTVHNINPTNCTSYRSIQTALGGNNKIKMGSVWALIIKRDGDVDKFMTKFPDREIFETMAGIYCSVITGKYNDIDEHDVNRIQAATCWTDDSTNRDDPGKRKNAGSDENADDGKPVSKKVKIEKPELDSDVTSDEEKPAKKPTTSKEKPLKKNGKKTTASDEIIENKPAEKPIKTSDVTTSNKPKTTKQRNITASDTESEADKPKGKKVKIEKPELDSDVTSDKEKPAKKPTTSKEKPLKKNGKKTTASDEIIENKPAEKPIKTSDVTTSKKPTKTSDVTISNKPKTTKQRNITASDTESEADKPKGKKDNKGKAKTVERKTEESDVDISLGGMVSDDDEKSQARIYRDKVMKMQRVKKLFQKVDKADRPNALSRFLIMEVAGGCKGDVVDNAKYFIEHHNE